MEYPPDGGGIKLEAIGFFNKVGTFIHPASAKL